jgi:hypothetical protein
VAHRFVATAKKNLRKGKNRYNVVCDIAALNKTSKINQASARTSRPHTIKEGESSCFGHMKNMSH